MGRGKILVKLFREKFKKDKLIAVVAFFIISVMVLSGALVSYAGKIKSDVNERESEYIKNIDMKIEKNLCAVEELEKTNKEDIEKNYRSYMRYNLEKSGNEIQRKIEDKWKGKNIGKNKEEIISHIKKVVFEETSVYGKDIFSIITVGGYSYFLVDDFYENSEPKINGKRILKINNRTRSVFDEVVWQEELKYVLSESGLINVQPYMNEYLKEKIRIYKKYTAIDERLSNTDIFKFKDIEYIEYKYPEIYKELLDYKIITSSDPESVENFMNFISCNRSSSEENMCYWNKNRRELLEVYVVPAGVFGILNESRTNGTGVFNDNYIKISLVYRAKNDEVFIKFKESFKMLENLKKEIKNDNLEKIEIKKDSERIRKLINLLMIIIPLINSIAVILTGFSYIRVPTGIISQSFLDKYVCKSCENSRIDNSAPKPKEQEECPWR